MTPIVLAFVMFAAVLHAGWNAVLRGGGDRLWSMTLMMIAIATATMIALPFLPWPNAASWPYAITSAVIHVGYNLSLGQDVGHLVCEDRRAQSDQDGRGTARDGVGLPQVAGTVCPHQSIAAALAL